MKNKIVMMSFCFILIALIYCIFSFYSFVLTSDQWSGAIDLFPIGFALALVIFFVATCIVVGVLRRRGTSYIAIGARPLFLVGSAHLFMIVVNGAHNCYALWGSTIFRLYGVVVCIPSDYHEWLYMISFYVYIASLVYLLKSIKPAQDGERTFWPIVFIVLVEFSLVAGLMYFDHNLNKYYRCLNYDYAIRSGQFISNPSPPVGCEKFGF